MDKGIKQAGTKYFLEQNELRRTGQAPYAGEKGNAAFRKAVIYWLVEQFGCTENAACTHYNNIRHAVKANPETAALIEGLGRPPEKNNGGRKKKAAPETEVTRDVVLANMMAAIPAATSEVSESRLLAGAVPPVVLAELEEALM